MKIDALSFSCVDWFHGINFSYCGDFAKVIHTVTQDKYTKLIRLMFKNAWDNRQAISCLDLWFPDEQVRTKERWKEAERIYEHCYRDTDNLHGVEKAIANAQNDDLYHDIQKTKKTYERIVKRRSIYNDFRKEFPDYYFLGG